VRRTAGVNRPVVRCLTNHRPFARTAGRLTATVRHEPHYHTLTPGGRRVNQIAPVAYTLAVGLLLFGGVTIVFQLRGMKALRGRTHVPSDELAYLRGRYRRRFVTGAVIAVIGALIGGSYLSGLEPKIDDLTHRPPAEGQEEGKRELTPDEKNLVRVWGAYWIGVLVLVFVVLGLALADTLATRRYAMGQYKILKEDHEAKLRRDLAVYKAQHDQRGGGRMRGKGEEEAPN
jgi:hypothetical protein